MSDHLVNGGPSDPDPLIMDWGGPGSALAITLAMPADDDGHPAPTPLDCALDLHVREGDTLTPRTVRMMPVEAVALIPSILTAMGDLCKLLEESGQAPPLMVPPGAVALATEAYDSHVGATVAGADAVRRAYALAKEIIRTMEAFEDADTPEELWQALDADAADTDSDGS